MSPKVTGSDGDCGCARGDTHAGNSKLGSLTAQKAMRRHTRDRRKLENWMTGDVIEHIALRAD
jgi:hypothetical protein